MDVPGFLLTGGWYADEGWKFDGVEWESTYCYCRLLVVAVPCVVHGRSCIRSGLFFVRSRREREDLAVVHGIVTPQLCMYVCAGGVHGRCMGGACR